MMYLIIGLISLAGGTIQAITGFGSGIVIMMGLPNFLSMNVAPAVSGAICMPLPFSLAYHYRKNVQWKTVLFPAVCYLLCSTIAIRLSKTINMNAMKPYFGLFLFLLALYFMFFSDKVKIKGGLLSAVFCCGISGFLGGFFGIGGPLMTLYFLAVTNNKEEYLGTINTTFAITSTYQTILRLLSGILTFDLLPVILVGVIMSLIGRKAGSVIADKMNAGLMKKLIYIFLMFTGVQTIIQSI